MSLVQAKDGTVHGFVSEFLYQCKLSSWTTNSYVNHIVSPTPVGPWKQAGAAVPVWAHNPRVVYSPLDRTWVMFHIGGATNDTSRAKRCDSSVPARSPQSQNKPSLKDKDSPTHPFAIHFTGDLAGPWQQFHGASSASSSRSFTYYEGVSNVDHLEAPAGGVWLYEASTNSPSISEPESQGKLYLDFRTNFTNNPHRPHAPLAWDACAPGLTFDNGHPLEDSAGSRVGAFRVVGNATIRAGSPCDVTYSYPGVDLGQPVTAANSTVSCANETNYFEIDTESSLDSGVVFLGVTQDAFGCRGACEVRADCTSYTWMSGKCYGVCGDGVW